MTLDPALDLDTVVYDLRVDYNFEEGTLTIERRPHHEATEAYRVVLVGNQGWTFRPYGDLDLDLCRRCAELLAWEFDGRVEEVRHGGA